MQSILYEISDEKRGLYNSLFESFSKSLKKIDIKASILFKQQIEQKIKRGKLPRSLIFKTLDFIE